jgi:UDP-N-acetylglucosamine 2-epimerase (non-hydrolysing)
MAKNVITVTGIRPDFIRMSEIFKKLDENFNHTLIHSGQHFDKLLSDVFFEELNIRRPDYNLGVGGDNREHFHQNADLSIKLIELIRNENLNPDIILFLGDSNSVTCSVPLKKEGYKIGHVEAGMRSYDKRMLEEINRVVCDHCSDILFVYHENYKEKAVKENIDPNSIFVVGNTIVEIVKKFKFNQPKRDDLILVDIHRPENFKYIERMENIIEYANLMGQKFKKPIIMLGFKRTLDHIKKFNLNLGNIKIVDLMPYGEYIQTVYNSSFIISDSGTGQEEPAILDTPVIVPRDFTERPESMENNCSFMINVNKKNDLSWTLSEKWLSLECKNKNVDWLGDGKTSDNVINILKKIL